jgi:hypothetical protein
VAWNVDVDLGVDPVDCHDRTVPLEEESVYESYNAFQRSLFEMGCPETEVRTRRKSTKFSDRVTIVVLSNRPDCIELLLEGV